MLKTNIIKIINPKTNKIHYIAKSFIPQLKELNPRSDFILKIREEGKF